MPSKSDGAPPIAAKNQNKRSGILVILVGEIRLSKPKRRRQERLMLRNTSVKLSGLKNVPIKVVNKKSRTKQLRYRLKGFCNLIIL
jgi:hypothetical protein